MANLSKKLQDEAGLTSEQATKALSIFRDYLRESESAPELADVIAFKAWVAAKKVKETYSDVKESAGELLDKTGDKAEELIHKAKQQAKKVADKISDALDD